jgi:P-type Cu2+ transporter
VMMMATPSYVSGPGELAPDLRQLLNWGGWLLTLPVMLFSSQPFFRGAWAGLRQRRVGMDLPVALGIAIMFVASSLATFQPAGVLGHDVYFDSLTMFVGFLLGARWLEMRTRHTAAEALESSLARLPDTAQLVAADGSVHSVSVLRLQPGDQVRVPLGAAFPADGVLTEGHTQADESLLSGESAAVPKGPGAAVVAGSVNLGAPVLMEVQRVGGDTRFEAIVSMMRSAMSQRPSSARLADRWAAPFLVGVMLLAAGAAAVWSVVDPSRAVWVAVSVLIVTCPCALSLAAPAVLVAATRGLSRRGVMVQRLDALEPLARTRHFFFDKTGTLTDDQPELSATLATPAALREGFNESDLRAQAAQLARWSTHPASVALCRAAEADSNVQAPMALQAVEEAPGRGLQAMDAQGCRWRLGRADWAVAQQGAGAPVVPAADDEAGQVLLSRDGQVLAAFELTEALRAGAAEAMAALKADGVRVSLLSGDTPARAQALGRRLGLDDAAGGATPEGKLAAMAAAQAQGLPVAMVGDGINDAPVLARADVSLAMGQGALVSRSQADAVITSNRLTDLVAARHTAQRAMRIVRQNMLWAAGYNLVCIPLALLGYLPPWAAGLGMAASSLAVVMNATRAAR